MDVKNSKVLQAIGLTESETEVFLAGLKLGTASASNIASKTSLKRPNVYKVLSSLVEKKLCSIEIVGLKKMFRVQHPDNLLDIANQRVEMLKTILPNLIEDNAKTPSKGEIRIMYGLKSLKKIYFELLDDHRQGEFYYVTSNLERWKNLDTEFLDEFIESRVKKNIAIKIISENNESGKYYKRFEKNFNQEVKLTTYSLPTDTIITPRKIIITSFDKSDLTLFIIENPLIINSYKVNFDIMWNLS